MVVTCCARGGISVCLPDSENECKILESKSEAAKEVVIQQENEREGLRLQGAQR